MDTAVISYKERFMDIYTQSINRNGSFELLEWIKSTDFFTSPASTKFHCAYKGGLVEHSVNVYYNLMKLNSVFNFCQNEESLAIVSLLHDLTKAQCYKVEFRNVKNEQGIWEKVPNYVFSEDFRYGGHGSKSVFLIMKCMQLTDEEASAINNHMSAFDRPCNDWSLSNAFEQFPLGMFLHTADCISSWVTEVNKN